jgi:hypothetical protein
VLAGFSKGGVLREESIAGVEGVGAGAASDVEDEATAEIGFGSGRRAKAEGFVGGEDVESSAVGVREDGDGGQAEFATGADETEGNFSAVGDEDFAHGLQGTRDEGVGDRV